MTAASSGRVALTVIGGIVLPVMASMFAVAVIAASTSSWGASRAGGALVFTGLVEIALFVSAWIGVNRLSPVGARLVPTLIAVLVGAPVMAVLVLMNFLVFNR